MIRFFSLREAIMAKRYFDLLTGYENKAHYTKDMADKECKDLGWHLYAKVGETPSQLVSNHYMKVPHNGTVKKVSLDDLKKVNKKVSLDDLKKANEKVNLDDLKMVNKKVSMEDIKATLEELKMSAIRSPIPNRYKV